MFRADRVGRGQRVVRQFVVFCDFLDEVCGGLPAFQFLTEEGVEHGARGVQCLQFVLNVESVEDVGSVVNRQVRAVGVVRRCVFAFAHGRRDDVGVLLFVVLRQSVRGGLCGRSFEVVEVAVFFLIVGQLVAHEVQRLLGEFLRFFVGKVFAYPSCVEAGFVHTDKTDGGEVVVEGAEITFGVRIESFVHQLGDDVTFDFQAACRNVHEAFEVLEVFAFRSCLVRDSGHIDGDDADRTRGFAASEETAGFLTQFSEVETQTAAHTSDVAGFHVAVDVVAEIRSAVFCGHLEQQTIVFGFRPVEVGGDGVGGDRILESSAVGVAFYHDFDERLVDHRHFFLAVLVFEIHFLAADERGEFREVARDNPVQSDVGERRLRAPAGRSVHAVDERLQALFDLFVGEVVDLDERSKVGVERGERLRARPFVLHNAEEVDHLVAES